MAPLSVKRQPRQGGAVKKPRKRQKVEVQESYDLEESHKEGLGLARSVCVDEFSWQEVALPDRLEDAEGFFGLEEIDGVDVLRPQGKGDVRYRVGALFNYQSFRLRQELTCTTARQHTGEEAAAQSPQRHSPRSI